MGGKVRYLVALDIEHHIFLSEWAQEYPEAKLIGPEGLPEKRLKAAGQDPKIGREPFAVVFRAAQKREIRISEEFDRDFDYEYVETHPNRELVFYYRPDRVLIEADLMFNLPATEQYSRVPAEQKKEGFLSRLFAGLQTPGEGDPKGMKRLLWYGISGAKRDAFNESVRRIDSWDFATLIPCHGDTLEGNGKEVFERVFEWHLKGRKAGGGTETKI
ncbi:hypothetical protein VTK73DRAFT_8111 [Phialemonium thermophilum]|uniref:Uncharacterized protein n=1 Tax=Phialemonium thermophilum TaxID=223376 RepID=A0ABR3WA67_9PEZI